MTTTKRREREKKLRAEQILDAAEQLIFDNSIESIKMDSVAEIAELSKGTLYLYFKSKTELALAVYIRGMRILLSETRKQMSQPGTGIEMIQSMSKVFFQFMEKNPQYYRLFLYFEAVGMDVFSELRDTQTLAESDELGMELQQLIIRAVQIGIQDGTIDSELDPNAISLHIMASIRGIVQLANFYEEGYFTNCNMPQQAITIKNMIDTFMNVLIRALRPVKK